MSKRKHIAFASIALTIAALVPIAAWLICEGLQSLGVVDWAAQFSSLAASVPVFCACMLIAGTSLAELID